MQARQLGSRRELFVDDDFFLTTGTAVFDLHKPVMREVALKRDGAGDDAWTSYYNIIFDGEKYMMYYTAHGWEGEMEGKWPHQHICCAESRDGVHWEKPNYGIYEFHGTTDNNIVYLLKDDLLDNFGAMYDTNPACPADEKYKALAERVINDKVVLNAVTSPDGVHWTDRGTVITEGTFDSLNTCYYDEEAGKYHAYVRSWETHIPSRNLGESDEQLDQTPKGAEKTRTVSAFISEDFYHWTPLGPLDFADRPAYQLYSNNIAPYYRAPQFIFGFPTRYFDRTYEPILHEIGHHRWLSAEEFGPDSCIRSETSMTDGLFMSSRDGVNFKRFDDTPFFPSGIEGRRNWIYGDAYPCHGMVQSPSDREGEPDEISMFVPDTLYGVLRRCTIRLDGFVSLHAGYTETELLTKPFIFEGSRLEFNYRTTVAGYFRAELLDEYKNPFPGLSMSDCWDMYGDTVSRDVCWNGRRDVSAAAGKKCYMRIRMKECDLFSFRFH